MSPQVSMITLLQTAKPVLHNLIRDGFIQAIKHPNKTSVSVSWQAPTFNHNQAVALDDLIAALNA